MDMITEANHPIERQTDGDTRDWVPPRYVPCGRYGCLLCVPVVDAGAQAVSCSCDDDECGGTCVSPRTVRDVRVVGGKVPLATGTCGHHRPVRYNLTVGWCRHADDDSVCEQGPRPAPLVGCARCGAALDDDGCDTSSEHQCDPRDVAPGY